MNVIGTNHCAFCLLPSNFGCSRCNRVFYCGPVHQLSLWASHKLSCVKKGDGPPTQWIKQPPLSLDELRYLTGHKWQTNVDGVKRLVYEELNDEELNIAMLSLASKQKSQNSIITHAETTAHRMKILNFAELGVEDKLVAELNVKMKYAPYYHQATVESQFQDRYFLYSKSSFHKLFMDEVFRFGELIILPTSAFGKGGELDFLNKMGTMIPSAVNLQSYANTVDQTSEPGRTYNKIAEVYMLRAQTIHSGEMPISGYPSIVLGVVHTLLKDSRLVSNSTVLGIP